MRQLTTNIVAISTSRGCCYWSSGRDQQGDHPGKSMAYHIGVKLPTAIGCGHVSLFDVSPGVGYRQDGFLDWEAV